MATIKSFSDLEQSKKLAEILPLESADMYYPIEGASPKFGVALLISTNIPCWSLAALLDIIPIMIGSVFEKDALRLRIDKSEIDFNIWYSNLDTDMVEEGFDVIKTNPVDACYEMIIRLHELNLL